MRFFIGALLASTLLQGCRSSFPVLPYSMAGTWESKNSILQRREKIGFFQYKFHRDTVVVTLNTDTFGNILGKFGDATIIHGSWKNNRSFQSTDSLQVIAIGKINLHGAISKRLGKIETLELWAILMTSKMEWNIEIRHRHGWDATPMGNLVLKKLN